MKNVLKVLLAINLVSLSICFANENINQEVWSLSTSQKRECSTGNQIANNDCINKKYQESDKRLNYLYKKLVNSLQDPTLLMKSQQVWITFRDLSCKYELSGLSSEGSLNEYERLSCLIDKTEKRILDINQYLAWTYDGSPPRKPTGQF